MKRSERPAQKTIGVRDAKARLSELLRDAQLGREWIITERGRPIARIVPVESGSETLERRLRRLEQNGILERVLPNPVPVPPPLRLEKGLARRLLDEDRGSRGIDRR